MDEADLAADAGLGAQALLGLAAGNNIRLPSLANISEPLHHRHVSEENARYPLTSAPPSNGSQRLFFADRSASPLNSHRHMQHQRSETQLAALSCNNGREELPSHANANSSTPRLPSVSSAERTDEKDRALSSSSEPNVSSNPQMSIPRLASISEWAPSGTPSLLSSVPALPRLHNPLQLHSVPSLPTSSLSLPSPQPQTELPPTHSWAGPSLHAFLPQFPAPPVRQDWPPPAPLVYSFPSPHGPAIQSDASSYYYRTSSTSQFAHHAPQLPQLHRQRAPLHVPQYVGVPSSEPASVLRSSLSPNPEQGGESLTRPQRIGHSLAPILDAPRKELSEDSATPRASDLASALLSVAQRESEAPQLSSLSVPSKSGEPSKPKPARKSVFAGPASGRGLVDLMNPTDTLATAAASVEPIPTEEVRTVSHQSAEKNASALAHQIFGTGTEVSRTKVGQTSPFRRTKNADGKNSFNSGGRSQSLSNSLVSPSADDDFKNKIRLNSSRGSPAGEWDVRVTEKESVKSSSKRGSYRPQRSVDDYDSSWRQGTKKSGISFLHKSESSSSGGNNTPLRDYTDDVSESDSSTESEITRCPCGSAADSGTMIACDQCNTWQHRICMGFRRKSDVPQMYYCHICKPEEMRPSCVAHPKFKERQMAKDKDEQCEPILLSVKPLELRKLFSADLKAKQNGTRPICLPEVFLRYANLYRTQFGKDRQSVLEGLVVLTEISRSEAQHRLERAIRRSKMGKGNNTDSMELPVIERANRRRHHQVGSGSVPSPAPSTPCGLPAQSRSSGQKRSRPSPVSPDKSFDEFERAKANGLTSPGKEISSGEAPRMSREERKVKQLMGLFARMEQREKKRPKIGEASGSPRASAVSSPKPNGPISGSRPSVSPKSPTRSLRLSPPLESSKIRSTTSPTVEKQKLHEDKAFDCLSSPREELPYPSSPSVAMVKRERSGKDRKELRRRDQRPTSACTGSGDAVRRNGFLPRRRERQVLSSVTVRNRKSGKSEPDKLTNETEPNITFRFELPGPSVLGSILVPCSRVSVLDNAAKDAELEDEGSRDLGSSKRLDKKRWLLEGGPKRPELSTSRRPVLYPFRKRVLRYSVAIGGEQKKEMPELSLPSLAASTPLKKEMVGVSMVVVSKRDELPDGGKGLEHFLAAEAVTPDQPPVPEFNAEPCTLKDFSFKKRYRMRLLSNQSSSITKEACSSSILIPIERVRKMSKSTLNSPRRFALRSVPFRSAFNSVLPQEDSSRKKGGLGAMTPLKPTSGAIKKRILRRVRQRTDAAPIENVEPEVSEVLVKTEASFFERSSHPSSSSLSNTNSPAIHPKHEASENEHRASQLPTEKSTREAPLESGVSEGSRRSSPPRIPNTAFARISSSHVRTPALSSGATTRNARTSPPVVPSPAFVSGEVARKSRNFPPPVPTTAFARNGRGSPPPLPGAAFPREGGARATNKAETLPKSATGTSARNARTPPLRSAAVAKGVMLSDDDPRQFASKTGVVSSVQRDTKTSPLPVRSSPIAKDTDDRSATLGQPVVESDLVSPIPQSARTPLRLRSVPRPNASVSGKANGVLSHGLKHSPAQQSAPNGRNLDLSIDIPVTEETTASDILHLRLQGFLHQSSSSKDQASPGSSNHLSLSSSISQRRTPNRSPRSKVMPPPSKYPGMGISNSWRSVDRIGSAKRVHGPGVSSLTPSPPTSARLSTNSSYDRSAMRNVANKLPLANGKSPHQNIDEKASITPWRNYRQQNGWAQKISNGPHRHMPYSSSSSSAAQDKNSKNSNNGHRRRPYS